MAENNIAKKPGTQISKKDSLKKEKTPFFKGLQIEFGKITWPTKPQLMRQTVAVVCVSVVLGVVIALLDMLIQYGVSFITG